MTIEEFCEQFSDEKVLFEDGFEDAFMGVANVNGLDVAVYDEKKCIDVLREQGMSGLEAREYFDFNVAGSYVGERTPIYVTRYKKPKLDSK